MRLLQLCLSSLWLIVNDLVISGMTSPERIRFKPYSPYQAMLLPPSLDEMIATNHPVRVVNRVIDQIDIRPLIRTYKGGAVQVIIPGCCSKCLFTLTCATFIRAGRWKTHLGKTSILCGSVG